MNRRAARRARFGLDADAEPPPPMTRVQAKPFEAPAAAMAHVPPTSNDYDGGSDARPQSTAAPTYPPLMPVQLFPPAQTASEQPLISSLRRGEAPLRGTMMLQQQLSVKPTAPLVDFSGIDESEDPHFVVSTRLLLKDARSDLRAANFDPIRDVGQLLADQKGMGPEEQLAQIELHLSEFRDMREDADRLLTEYITEHYSQFSSSIQYFSNMILNVSASCDTVSLLKRNVSLATAGMATHDVELAQLRRRGLRNVFVKNLLEDVRTCMALEKDIASLVVSKHYVAGAEKVKRLENILSKPALRSIKALSPIAEFAAAAPTAHSRLIIKDLLHCVYRVDKLQDLSDRLFGGVTAASKSRDYRGERERRISAERLQKLLAGVDSAGDPHDANDFVTFIPSCVAALVRLGKLEDAQTEFFSQCSHFVEKYIAAFLQLYADWYKTLLFRGSADAGAAASLPRDPTAKAEVGAVEEAKLCDKQKGVLGGLLSSLLKELFKIIRNANYLANVAATAQFPFLAPIIEDSSLRASPELWNVERAPLQSPQQLEKLLSAAKAETSAKLAASGGGQGTEVVMTQIWKEFDLDAVVRKATSFPASSALKSLLSRIDSSAAAALAHSPLTCRPEVVQTCSGLLRETVTKYVQTALRSSAMAFLTSWDSAVVWSHVNHLLEKTLRPVCVSVSAEGALDFRAMRYKSSAEPHVLAAVRKYPTLSQMLSSRSSATGPRFIEDAGDVYYSLTELQHEKQRQRRGLHSETSRGLRAVASPDTRGAADPDSGAADIIAEAWDRFRPYLVFGVFNTPVCIIAVCDFIRACRELLPQISAGQYFTVMQPLAVDFAPKFVASLRRLLHTKINKHFERTWQRVSSRIISSSPHPVLASCIFVDSATEEVVRSARRLEACLPEEHRPTIGPHLLMYELADGLIEEIAYKMKRQIHALVEGSAGQAYLDPLFDAAFSHMPPADWKMLCNEQNLFGAHFGMDCALLEMYNRHNTLRMRSHYSPTAGTNEDPNAAAAETATFAELPMTAVAELALVCHSAELLVDRLSARHWGDKFTAMQPRCCIPGSLLNSTVSMLPAADPMSTRLIELHQRLISVSQAALFYLSFDVRAAAFRTLPQLRDESYAIVTARLHPDAFIEEYQRIISRTFATVAPHLSERKLKFMLLSMGKPIADVMINELSHLRDKTISAAGVQQLKLDVLAVQDCLHAQLPLDAEVRGATMEFLSRARGYFSLLKNRNCVEELLADGCSSKYSVTEMENLVSLVFRQDSDGLLENIHLLRQRLSSAKENSEGTQQPAEGASDSVPTVASSGAAVV